MLQKNLVTKNRDTCYKKILLQKIVILATKKPNNYSIAELSSISGSTLMPAIFRSAPLLGKLFFLRISAARLKKLIAPLPLAS